VAKISHVQARHNARVKALQALYQWDLNDSNVKDIETQFLDTQEMDRVDLEYFSALLHGVPALVDKIDESLATCLDRPVDELDPIERAICRIGAWELIERLELPVKVIINESVEITKKFGADQGHRFVNGVMDKLAGVCRPVEVSALDGKQSHSGTKS